MNLQGDVVGLINSSGSYVAKYTYDAWGNILSATGELAEINPLRYRGYYFDSETGFYYLQSRYYDPVNHRFINADVITFTGLGFAGTNMFAYCNNNPVITADKNGRWLNIVIGAVVGAVVSFTSYAIQSKGDMSVGGALASIGVGAVTGALVGTGQMWAVGVASGLSGTYAAVTTDGPISQKIFAGGIASAATLIGGIGSNALGATLVGSGKLVEAIGNTFINYTIGSITDLSSLGLQSLLDNTYSGRKAPINATSTSSFNNFRAPITKVSFACYA